MEFKILKIDANITYPLRHALLRKGKPLRSCYFKNDKAIQPDNHSASAKDGPDDKECSLDIL